MEAEFTWQINTDLLQQMKMSKRKQKFTSKIYNISELNWVIVVHPNGIRDTDAGNFFVALKPLSIPNNWSHTVLSCNISCPETLSSFSCMEIINSSTVGIGWFTDTMRLSEIQSLNQLSLIISIRINRIALNNNKIHYQRNTIIPSRTKFEWRLITISETVVHHFFCPIAKIAKNWRIPTYYEMDNLSFMVHGTLEFHVQTTMSRVP